MKIRSLTSMWALQILGLAVSSAAFAKPVERPQPPPAAPEPNLLLMAASGVLLVGGYIVWRRKQAKHASAT